MAQFGIGVAEGLTVFVLVFVLAFVLVGVFVFMFELAFEFVLALVFVGFVVIVVVVVKFDVEDVFALVGTPISLRILATVTSIVVDPFKIP